MREISTWLLAAVLTAITATESAGLRAHTGGERAAARRMSFHNRLLLNRAVLAGVDSIQVLVLATAVPPPPHGVSSETPVRFASGEVSALVARLGGRTRWTDEPIGYLRVEVPTDKLLALTDARVVAAYQIASFSKGSWYRDGPPLSNATMYRGFEVSPVASAEPERRDPKLPMLTVAESRAPGFTLEEDAGVGRWMKDHPTFDGRGVTIALVENALPDFSNPSFRLAKSADGRDLPKIAGILNAIDPDAPDETRVSLDTVVDTNTPWARVGRRTLILPRPGSYQLGTLPVSAGGNLVHQFAVAEHRQTHEVWIDSNGDASFADETPLADVNDRFDPQFLQLTHPAKTRVSFVMGRGEQPHTVHIYMGKGSHQTMTMSVAAGGEADESLAYGVAPSARVLLVRGSSQDYELSGIVEGFIRAARRTDVDVIGASAGIKILTDTSADFTGILFDRLVDVYGKPIVNSAGNFHLQLGSSYAFGSSWAVGGVLGPKTLAALHGSRPLEGLIVHPYGAAGPALDGAIKPDFLAPMERLAADLPWRRLVAAVPENAPRQSLPPGYQISCCTSSTSPYATGFVALLISAAKQTDVPYSVASLDRALKLSARFLAAFPSHEQGNGALDIAGAWDALKDPGEPPPRITASAGIVHPLAQYSARGPEGVGIFEFEGWRAGQTGTREFRFRRESGPDRPIEYRVAWSGNDGTFSAAPSIVLPRAQTVVFPVRIQPLSPGAHSALLDVQDARSKKTVFRTQATIVASEHVDPSTGSLRMTGRIGLMRMQHHYVHVPPDTAAISIELDVRSGVIQPTILPSHGLFPGYYLHVHPMNLRFVGPGKHVVVLPNPEPGTWTIQLENTSAGGRFGPDDNVPTNDADAEYSVTVRMLGAFMQVRSTSSKGLELEIRNPESTIREPVIQATPGTFRSHRSSFNANGLPNVVEIAVPENASSLSLALRSEQPTRNAVELLLYDCTTGECFSYDLGFPAAASQKMVVRNPRAGRWVATVEMAPFPGAAGSFVLDEIVTSGAPVRQPATTPRELGKRWTEWVPNVSRVLAPEANPSEILLLELLDAATERDEVKYPWIVGPNPRTLRDRPVALGSSIYRR